MKLGIDFGTSYSAAAISTRGKVKSIKFNDEEQFRTAAYFPEKVPSLSDYRLTPELQQKADAYFRQAKAQYTRDVAEANSRRAQAMREKNETRRARALELIVRPRDRSDDELRRDAEGAVRRQWIDEQVRKAKDQLGNSKDAVFGEEAINAYLSEGTGRLVQSPKSLLGYKMDSRVLNVVTDIVGNVFDHILRHATDQLKVTVNRAVVGRPVEFRSSMKAKGNEQAIEIIRTAATNAGFEEVEFMEEPVAAALGFHRECGQRQRALIFDIGGGTTDFAFVELGGSKRPEVFGSWGLGVGGSDVDLEFSLAAFMPLFGKEITDIPNVQYYAAAAVTDARRQAEFLKHNYQNVDPPYGSRLRALQRPGRTDQLGRSVERAKIFLSEHEAFRHRLSYIEDGLVVQSNRATLLNSSAKIRANIERKLEDIKSDVGKAPDVVFLTGGMSQSPFVIEMAQRHFPKSRVLKGDASFGVVHGLACSVEV